MLPIRRLLTRATLALALASSAIVMGAATLPAMAQDKSGQNDQATVVEVRQIKLTEQHVKGFLGAQKDLLAITAKLEAAGDTIDAKLQKELDAIGVKNGFKDFAEFDEARSNILLVLAGIDPDTGSYTDPAELIKKDIEAIKGDKSLAEADRKSQLDEMNLALKEYQPLKHKENIEVVKKYAKQIDEALK